MDEWVWITRAGVAVALVLGVGNTVKLLVDARRAYREKRREQDVKRRLDQLLNWFDASGGGEAAFWGKFKDDEFHEAVLLGVKLGVLKLWWHEGQVAVRLTKARDAK